VLTRAGLGPALSSSFGRTGVVRDLQVDDEAATRRFPARVEAAAYFCCTQAMRPGLSGSCSVIVTVEAPHLLVDLRVATLEEADRQALVDRVEAVGGSIDVTSSAGRTHVRVRIPVDAAEAATAGSPT
jgi:hypothetical protein